MQLSANEARINPNAITNNPARIVARRATFAVDRNFGTERTEHPVLPKRNVFFKETTTNENSSLVVKQIGKILNL